MQTSTEEIKLKGKHEGEQFVKLFLKEKKARKRVLDYLGDEDKKNLALLGKRWKKIIQIECRDLKMEETFNDLINKFIKKSPKKPEGNIVKGTLFDIDESIVMKYKWTLLNPNEEYNNRIAVDLEGIIPKKLTKDFSWFIYYSPDIAKYMAIHRSIVDDSLEYFFKMNQRKRDNLELSKEGANEYSEVLEDELSVDKFKGIKDGMMIRHKLLQEKLKQKEAKEIEKMENADIQQIIKASQAKFMTFVLCEGGNFSLGIFDKEKEVTHKSDHKYVIRKKQGKRQIVKDKDKGGISSVGSQIRRANEVKHQENISEIVEEYRELLDASDYVFIHAPGENTSILFDEGKSLFEFKKNQNVKSLCLTAKKANWTELKKIREQVVKVYLIAEDDIMSYRK